MSRKFLLPNQVCFLIPYRFFGLKYSSSCAQSSRCIAPFSFSVFCRFNSSKSTTPTKSSLECTNESSTNFKRHSITLPLHIGLVPEELLHIFPLLPRDEQRKLLSEAKSTHQSYLSTASIEIKKQLNDQLTQLVENITQVLSKRFGNECLKDISRVSKENPEDTSPDFEKDENRLINAASARKLSDYLANESPPKVREGFFNMNAGPYVDPSTPENNISAGENVLDIGEDEPFQDDDIPYHAHVELERIREQRQYSRWIVWELPQLSKYARPFKPPTRDLFLRFRYTTHFGEPHPASNKVVLEFCPVDVPNLSQVQVSKLIKLLGPRYNPITSIARLSCCELDSPSANKQQLLKLVRRLLKESSDTSDTFEDIPFDFRHAKYKLPKRFFSISCPLVAQAFPDTSSAKITPPFRPSFPSEWILTPERRKELDSIRSKMYSIFS